MLREMEHDAVVAGLKFEVAVGSVLLAVALIVVLVAQVHPASQEPERMYASAHDRPLLETPQQVLEARATGTCAFDFDGMHYVVEGLPREYVDYSSWCVRMP